MLTQDASSRVGISTKENFPSGLPLIQTDLSVWHFMTVCTGFGLVFRNSPSFFLLFFWALCYLLLPNISLGIFSIYKGSADEHIISRGKAWGKPEV